MDPFSFQKLSVQNRRQAGGCGAAGRQQNRLSWFNFAEQWIGHQVTIK
jgi:hypothetical protein